MFEYKPDFDEVLDRYEAWWSGEIIDRPLTCIAFGKPPEQHVAVPEKQHATLRDRWFDTEYTVERAAAGVANTVYAADALPVAYPNLGPEIFSAFYGCELEFGDYTSWSVPNLKDWTPESVRALQLDRNGLYFSKLDEMTDAYIEAGKGKFIVGYTDLHPGGDAIAAFRDPQQLCIDMIEEPNAIKDLLKRVTQDFFSVYDYFYDKLSAAGMPSTTWLSATCRGKYHVPSNDFSCMVSDAMFEDVFLPGIVEECRHMDRSIYHLDGPEALRYLDTLLDIPEVHGIQWVAGAGNDYWGDWIDVYRRIQAAHKAFDLAVPVQDLDRLFTALRPEGVRLLVGGVADEDTARAAMAKISRWGVRGK